MKQSDLEATMDLHLRVAGITGYEREYAWHPTRKWRADFAWLAPHWILLEVEGGTYSGGRHVQGKGFEKDCIAYNEAALLGWRVLRVTGAMVKDGRALALVERALALGGESYRYAGRNEHVIEWEDA